MKYQAIKWIGLCCLLLGWYAQAEPYLAYKNNLKCSACHVNPNGGGLRNSFGNIYGYNQLSAKPLNFTSAQIGEISDYLRLGGNVRYNAEFSEDEQDTNSATFRMDSAQVYLALSPQDSGLTLYVDQQFAPGSAINREAFLMYRSEQGYYVKGGKMYVPFGIRLEDDTAFVRQVTGFNFDSSDNGFELGFEGDSSLFNVFISNGTSAVSNNDDKFLYGIKGEYLLGDGRIGATAISNNGDSTDTQMLNLYAGYHIGELTFLAEVDWIDTRIDGSPTVKQWVGLVEANYQWAQGLNVKLTWEYYDPNRDIDEDHETRWSLLTEYTPWSNIQFRAGIRLQDSIPQRPERNLDKLFVQTHFYF